MQLDKLTGKLARWALLLQKYDFEVVDKVQTSNLDVDGLYFNLSPLENYLIGARLHDDCQ